MDSARHFFPAESVKSFIDLMALYKFNMLHWHLVDDQGWTMPINAYTNLTRTGVHGGPYRTLNGTWMGLGNGEGSGRFYTKYELREIVRYAAARQITIVPEIEMPAHSAALLASYPELLRTSHAKPPLPELGTHGTYTRNVAWDAYREVCVGNEKTFEMLQTILAEVMEVFPGPFVHIGGDEAQKRGWQNCERCQARIQEAGLKNVEELQSYFVKRIGKYIQSKNRRLVGWDEIMQGGLADDAVVMSWTGIQPGQEAARKGFNVVFSPTSHCYFDAPWQSISTQKVYAFEPLADLDPQAAKHVLGVQGNLWSEKISDLRQLEYQAFPRACALAEVGWSVAAQRSGDEFHLRMGTHLKRLEALKVNYCREEAPGSPPSDRVR